MTTTEVRENYTAPRGGSVMFEPWPKAVHLLDEDIEVIGPVTASMVVADGEEAATISAELYDLPVSYGYKVTTSRRGGDKAEVFYITGAISEVVKVEGQDYVDLGLIPRVDPKTLQVTPDNTAAWDAAFQVVLDALGSKQPLDSDLTTIAGLDSGQAGALVSDGAGWIRKTYGQLKTALSLVKADVGLGNVPNVDATARANHTGTQAQSTIVGLVAALADIVTSVTGRVQKGLGWETTYVETPGDYTGRWNTPGTGTDARAAIQTALNAASQQMPGPYDWYKYLWRRAVTVTLAPGSYVLTAPTSGPSLNLPEGVTLDASAAQLFFDYPATPKADWCGIQVNNSSSLILPSFMAPSARNAVPAANPGSSSTKTLYDGVRLVTLDNVTGAVRTKGHSEIRSFYGAGIRSIGSWVTRIDGAIKISCRYGFLASNLPEDNVYGINTTGIYGMNGSPGSKVRACTDHYFDGPYFVDCPAGGVRGVVTGSATSPHDIDYTHAGGFNVYWKNCIWEFFTSYSVYVTGGLFSFTDCGFEEIGSTGGTMAQIDGAKSLQIRNHRVNHNGQYVTDLSGTPTQATPVSVFKVTGVQNLIYDGGYIFNIFLNTLALFDGSANKYRVTAPWVDTSPGLTAGSMYVANGIASNMMANNVQTALDAKQALDTDLNTIAALDSSTAGALVTDGSGWIRKTYAQLKTALSLVKGDVGLDNVDNTSDSAKPVSTAQQAALDGKRLRFAGCRLNMFGGGGVDFAIATSTLAAVNFGSGTEVYDTDAFHDTTTNNPRITIPTGMGGKYRLTAQVPFAANATGQRIVGFTKNGSGTYLARMRIDAAASGQTVLNVSTDDLAVAGDYYQMMVAHNVGSNLSTDTSADVLFFSIERLD